MLIVFTTVANAADGETLAEKIVNARLAACVQVRDFVTANHPYDVPEIVAVKAEDVAEAYASWMTDVLT